MHSNAHFVTHISIIIFEQKCVSYWRLQFSSLLEKAHVHLHNAYRLLHNYVCFGLFADHKKYQALSGFPGANLGFILTIAGICLGEKNCVFENLLVKEILENGKEGQKRWRLGRDRQYPCRKKRMVLLVFLATSKCLAANHQLSNYTTEKLLATSPFVVMHSHNYLVQGSTFVRLTFYPSLISSKRMSL